MPPFSGRCVFLAGLPLDLFFDPEHGVSTFIRNAVTCHKKYSIYEHVHIFNKYLIIIVSIIMIISTILNKVYDMQTS